MASSIPALVELAVLRWARESIGLTQVAAARKMDLADDRVARWEAGEAVPTVAQLRKAAAVYRRSLAVFFLPEPPLDFDTLRDFRRHPDGESGAWSPGLHTEYRRAVRQREHALELAELDEAEPPAAWRIDPLPEDDEDLAAKARAALLGASALRLPRATGSVYDHLNVWISGMEAAGVMVLATGGGQVAPSEMRAFSLYFEVLPVVVVNGADAPRGRLFSLLHECAHLLLHTAGLCDLVSDRRAVSPDAQLEARCNAIAAAVLMPRSQVLASPEVRAHRPGASDWTYSQLAAAAAPFGVSAEAFLRRLATVGRVSGDFYRQRRAEFLQAYEEEESAARPPGGDWYRNTVRDLGKGYVRMVAGAHRRRVIDSYTAATYLGVKVSQIERLVAAAAGGAR